MKRCPACGATYPSGEYCPVDGSGLVAVVAAAASAAPRAAAPPVARSGWAPAASAAQQVVEHVGIQRQDASELLAGTTLDQRYRIEKKIGAGGMGVVYCGNHAAIGKAVAVKVLRQSHAGLADVAERFAREAQMASQIKHPNVVQIFDYGTTTYGAPYYVMEHLAGHSLAWEIDHRGRLDVRRAVQLAIQVAKGLGEAHKHGVVHRDLKPDNVFLLVDPHEHEPDGSPREIAKILDFGIARAEGARRLTAAGAVVGTPEYMSPEQAQGHDVDGRTDLYALGIILFEMLTGKVPFRGDTMAGTLTKQVFDAAPSLREVEPDLPQLPQLERVVSRLLAKNPDERPGTAAESARMLEIARDAEMSSGRSASGRATVAIGSWSVGDQAPASLPSRPGAPAMGGPAMAPPPRTPSKAWAGSDVPASDVVGHQPLAANPPSVVVREGTPSHHIPANQVVAAGASAANTSQRSPAGQTRASAQAGLGVGPIIVLGVGAAVFAALVTVTAVRLLDQQSMAGPDSAGASLGSAMSASAPDESGTKDDSNVAAVDASNPDEGVPAEQERALEDEAAKAIPEPPPAPETTTPPRSKPRSKAKSSPSKKRSGPGSSKSVASAPKTDKPVADPPAPRPNNDPTQRPEAPSVSLGDLKDPFSDF